MGLVAIEECGEPETGKRSWEAVQEYGPRAPVVC